MNLIERWSTRIRGLFSSRRFDAELRAELDHHVAMETRRLMGEGMGADEARRQALRDFGGVQKAREQVHQEKWGGGLAAVWRDGRYAVRTLVRSPGYTVMTIATVALAIAANTAVFTVIRTTLLDPLPYPEASRLMRVVTGWQDKPDGGTSPAEFLDLEASKPGVAAIGAYSFGGLTLQEGDQAERIPIAVVTSGVLPALGVEPMLGRTFTREDGFDDAFLLLVTHGFWQQKLGGDPSVVGSTIKVSGFEATVLGVLPPEFRIPEEMYTSTQVDALLPTEMDPEQIDNRGSHYLNVVARLAEGTSLEQADAELDALVGNMLAEYPFDYPEDMRFGIAYRPLHESVVGDARPALLVAGAAVLFILLVACANLAALGLSRYEARHRELALRAALGAARGRLVTQVLVESLIVAAVGGMLGLGLARLAVEALVAASPADLPRLEAVALDGSVLAVGFGLSLLAGVGFGLLPAFGAAGRRLHDALRSGERGAASLRGERARQGLVVAQLALTVALLVGAGLLGRSFIALTGADPGYLTSGVTTARVSLPNAGYPTDEDRITFFREAAEALRQQPGVDAAGAVTNLPLATRLGDLNFRIEGVVYREDESTPAADWQVVVPGYFEAMGIQLVRGRTLEVADRSDTPGAVVVNETFAATFFPGEDALGKRFEPGGGAHPRLASIVGIVADVSHSSLGFEGRPQMYFAHDQFRFWGSERAPGALTFVVRSERPDADAVALVRDTLAGLDPSLAVFDVTSMQQVRSRAMARTRFFASLVGLFAATALLLAAVGVYGVVAYSVAVRRRELGIRLALGAGAGMVVRMVMGRSVRLTVAGLAIGGLIAAAGSRVVSGLLFGVDALDPVTLAAVPTLLAAVVMLGTSVPALRAVRSAIGALLSQG